MSDVFCKASGKIKYTSPQKASETQRHVDRRGVNKKKGRTYKCSACNHYHLTSKKELQK